MEADFSIAAAQLPSIRGDVEGNLRAQLRVTEIAAELGVDVIVFPELSITGYELDLASSLQLSLNDVVFDELKQAAKDLSIGILTSGPMRSQSAKPFLGGFGFFPEFTLSYAKIHVFETEQPFFDFGTEHCLVEHNGTRIGFAICADAYYPEHVGAAVNAGADVYAASVMKVPSELEVHHKYQRKYARQHGLVTLSANYCGETGGEQSAGRSAIWNSLGEQIGEASEDASALVIGRRIGSDWGAEVITI